MTLEVIGAGLGRTGTHSLKLALEALGLGPCHHMFELREAPGQLAHWQAAARGETMDWEAVFKGYRAQVDWPGAHYWRELIAAYPQAKVILTVRDADSWFDSFSQTIVRANMAGRELDPNPHTRAMAQLVNDLVFEQAFSGRMDDKAFAQAVFREHIAAVKAAVPADRLLVYEVSQGWQPLCAFLNRPVPDMAFPKTNQKAEFLKRKGFLPEA